MQTRNKTQTMVHEEFCIMCKGTLPLAVLTAIVLCLCGREVIPVLLGVGAGSAYSLFNFHSVCRDAMQAAMHTQPHLATRKMQQGFAKRYALLLVFLGVMLWSKQVDVIAVTVPLLYPKVIYTLRQIVSRYLPRKEDLQ